MPGKKITKQQGKIYMKERKDGYTQLASSARVGISERSGRTIEHGKLHPKQGTRSWRTRTDPFSDVWDSELVSMLESSPGLLPITLLEYLQEKYIDRYPDKLLRTMERRVKKWRALHGPEKEVMFRQIYMPGRQGFSDFTKLKGVEITIKGKPLKHLLYHFRLPYSKWSYMKVVLGGESYTALAEGLQEALWRLGGAPLEHRTDSLSAAFKNLTKDEANDITTRYKDFCNHYGMEASRNNRGKGHENGAVESPHGHIKKRVKQALILRRSNDFSCIEEYQTLIEKVAQSHNRRNAKQVEIERLDLRALPQFKASDFTEVVAKVTSSSTISVRRAMYTVPSRLNGEVLRVHLYHDRLNCYLGGTKAIALDRTYSTVKNKRARNIDYKHVIKSLVRKPQAFRYSSLRDDLLPTAQYKQIWSYIDATVTGKAACKLIVGLLYLAAEADCEKSLADYVMELIELSSPINLKNLRERYMPKHTDIPSVQVEQHTLQDYDKLIITDSIFNQQQPSQEVAYA
jgi:hypothetical protein